MPTKVRTLCVGAFFGSLVEASLPILLLKTDDRNISGVRKHSKHATDGIPKELRVGDLLLVQVTYASMTVPVSRVRYRMTFVRCYEDAAGESYKIWGHRWRYIIEGKYFCTLRYPFDLDSLKCLTRTMGRK